IAPIDEHALDEVSVGARVDPAHHVVGEDLASHGDSRLVKHGSLAYDQTEVKRDHSSGRVRAPDRRQRVPLTADAIDYNQDRPQDPDAPVRLLAENPRSGEHPE